MSNITLNQERAKKTSAIVFAIFAVVAISTLAIIVTLDDASAIVVRHASFHGKHGHGGHATCIRVHGHVRCHGHRR